nr:hypothetical protein [Micromonospora sp. DSM 115978]
DAVGQIATGQIAAVRDRDRTVAAIEALQSALAGLPSFAATRATLAVAAVAVHDDLARQLVSLADQLAEQPLAAAQASRALDTRLRVTEWEPASLLVTARTLAARDDLAAGLLALTAVRAGASRTRWAAPWRDELRRLRRHQQPAVRAAALEVFTDAE